MFFLSEFNIAVHLCEKKQTFLNIDHYNKVVLRGNTTEEVDPPSGYDNGLISVGINLYKTRWDMDDALWKEAQEDQRKEREAIEKEIREEEWKRMQERRKEEMQKEEKQREEKREMERRQALQNKYGDANLSNEEMERRDQKKRDEKNRKELEKWNNLYCILNPCNP